MDPEETPLKQIRTFQGDVAEALRRQKGSLVSIQQAEQAKKNALDPLTTTLSESSRRRMEFFYLLLGSLTLIVLGATGAWFAYNEFLNQRVTPVTVPPDNRFIPVNTVTNLNLTSTTREDLITALSNASQNSIEGEIIQINLSLSTSQFLEKLGTRAPGNLVRAFGSPFMFGAFGESNFLIIKLASFENAFAGMLAWEKNLAQDIGPLFATAELSEQSPLGATFVDITDKNKDVRVLDVGGQTVLLYSFFDNKMLIITDKIETLRIVVERLALEKLSR